MEKWQATHPDSVIGDHDDGACVEVVGEIVEVIQDHLSLIRCLRCSPAREQDHRWRPNPQHRQKRSEVRVAGDSSVALRRPDVTARRLGALKAQLKRVDRIMARGT